METDKISGSAYTGTKRFTQQDVRTANATGFGAAADDYAERGIDLNEQLIRNKPATFFFRMNGDAMIEAGIFDRDILIVDRSVKAVNGKVIIAVYNGELVVRRLEKNINKIKLIPDNRRMQPVEVQDDPDFNVWGVVMYNIHAVWNGEWWVMNRESWIVSKAACLTSKDKWTTIIQKDFFMERAFVILMIIDVSLTFTVESMISSHRFNLTENVSTSYYNDLHHRS